MKAIIMDWVAPGDIPMRNFLARNLSDDQAETLLATLQASDGVRLAGREVMSTTARHHPDQVIVPRHRVLLLSIWDETTVAEYLMLHAPPMGRMA